MTPLAYYLWGALKDKDKDKPETIEALKDNIHKVIGEIQLHTIDNVLKNWTDRVGYTALKKSANIFKENKKFNIMIKRNN